MPAKRHRPAKRDLPKQAPVARGATPLGVPPEGILLQHPVSPPEGRKPPKRVRQRPQAEIATPAPRQVVFHAEEIDEEGQFIGEPFRPEMRRVSLLPEFVGDIPELFPAITNPKQRLFLCAFSLCGVREDAARQAGIDIRYHRVWLTTDVAYATAFAEAERVLGDLLEDAMMKRGVQGYEEDVYFMGQRIPGASKRKYSDQFVSFALPFVKPERYAKSKKAEEQVSDLMAEMIKEWDAKPPEASLPPTALGEGSTPPWEQQPSIEATADEVEEEGEGDDFDEDEEDEEEIDEEEPETPNNEFVMDDTLPVDQNPFLGPPGAMRDIYEEEQID